MDDSRPVDPFADTASLAAIRAAIGEICARFPAAYWRDLDAHRAYPDAFVRALTDAG